MFTKKITIKTVMLREYKEEEKGPPKLEFLTEVADPDVGEETPLEKGTFVGRAHLLLQVLSQMILEETPSLSERLRLFEETMGSFVDYWLIGALQSSPEVVDHRRDVRDMLTEVLLKALRGMGRTEEARILQGKLQEVKDIEAAKKQARNGAKRRRKKGKKKGGYLN